MTRGRLIFPMKVKIAPLDAAATASEQGSGVGPGYDPDFREPVRLPETGLVVGPSARAEGELVELSAQVEDEAWEQLRMARSGDIAAINVVLVFHFKELEARGFIDEESGDATCPRKGDRLEGIYDPRTGAVIQRVPTPPGLYCVEAQPRSYGLSSLKRNLLVCTFRSRDPGSMRG